MKEDSEQVTGFVATGHVVGFVLDVNSPVETEGIGEGRRLHQRRDVKAGSGHIGDSTIEFGHNVDDGVVVEPASPTEPMQGQTVEITNVGVRIVTEDVAEHVTEHVVNDL